MAINTTIIRSASDIALKLNAVAPELAVFGGIGSMVAGTILACQATAKLAPVMDKAKTDWANVDTALADESIEDYTEDTASKDRGEIVMSVAKEAVKAYAPAVAASGLGAGAILAGHNVTRQRAAVVAGAFAAMKASYDGYRERVAETYGEDAERAIRNPVRTEIVTREVTDPETGEVTTETQVLDKMDLSDYSSLARFFDENSRAFDPDSHENNMAFILQQQKWCNERLRREGYLYLNEVYKCLGLPVSEAGRVMGWVYDENRSDLSNKIDFNIFNPYSEENRNFVGGNCKYAVLDFNVDGAIYELTN